MHRYNISSVSILNHVERDCCHVAIYDMIYSSDVTESMTNEDDSAIQRSKPYLT